MQFFHKTNIDFVGKRYLFFGVSGFFILLGIASYIVRGGFNYGIDFSGGILLQLGFDKPVAMDTLRSALVSSGIEGFDMQSSGASSVIIRIKKKDYNAEGFSKKVMGIITEKLPEYKANMERMEYVGPAIGRHLGQQAFLAIIFSFIGIIIYVAFRFHSGLWGASGVFALMHDVWVVAGIFAFLNKEITLTVIAALLTLAGYSINDTIVVFDRIRDNLRYMSKDSLYNIINTSINQTLSRTINTSLTVFLVVLALFLFGGEVIHDFAFAMLIGVVFGTYSSIYVASPMIFEWEEFKKRRTQRLRGPGR